MLIYGDSLTVEATSAAVKSLTNTHAWRPVVKALPGVALCEYTATLARDLAVHRPDVVTLQTHGGTNSPATGCFPATVVRDSPAYYARYRSDLRRIFDAVTRRGAKVVFFATPPDRAATSEREQRELRAIAAELAGRYREVRISDAGRDALGGSSFHATLRCLPNERRRPECVHGSIAVRAADGVHFCPTPYPNYASFFDGCPDYSSGAARYGRALTEAITGRKLRSRDA